MQSEKTSTYWDGLFPSAETRNPRQATPEDVPIIVELGKEFHQHSPWRGTNYDVATVTTLVTQLVLGGGVFLNDQGGFIAGMISPLMFDHSVTIAAEIAWWAPNGGGRELRQALEDWARDVGATIIQFSALGDENIEKVHSNMVRNGFKLAELSYVKGL